MKKCLVLDLDNTLWGGVVGEDGKEHLALGLTPPGSGFLAFQQVIRDLFDRGIILAINSKNNFDEAMDVIRTHPNMILKEHHFAAMRMNWQNKVKNLQELAKELNIGLDSMVFLDDDPTNRAMVRTYLPAVETPDLPTDSELYAKFLLGLPYFETGVITDEDKMRGNYYVTERLRKEAEKQQPSSEEFLKSLGIEVSLRENDEAAAARLAQMSEKTNQFNVDKKPFTEEEILFFMKSSEYMVLHAYAVDKFGTYGIIAFALVEKRTSHWHIRSFLMSCRIIGRGVEDAFFSSLATKAFKAGVTTITISFRETEKNKPAEAFVQKYFPETTASLDRLINPPSWVQISWLS